MDADDLTNQPHGAPAADPTPVRHYAIRVRGHLAPRRAAWFDGLTVSNQPDGTTVIRGPVTDQAALHGLLQKLRDLGVTLLSLTATAPGDAVEPPTSHTTDSPDQQGARP